MPFSPFSLPFPLPPSPPGLSPGVHQRFIQSATCSWRPRPPREGVLFGDKIPKLLDFQFLPVGSGQASGHLLGLAGPWSWRLPGAGSSTQRRAPGCPSAAGRHVVAREESGPLRGDTLTPAIGVAAGDADNRALREGELVVLLASVRVQRHHCEAKDRGLRSASCPAGAIQGPAGF